MSTKKIEEKKVFLPVEVDTELPKEHYRDYPVILSSGRIKESMYQDDNFMHANVTHWLKEENKILISSEELVELLREAYNQAMENDSISMQGETYEMNFEKFCESKGLSTKSSNQNQEG